MTTERLQQIQTILRENGIEAWLLYSFRDSNPIAVRILGMTPEVHQTRRWACLIPAEGEPRGLAHRIEPHIAAHMTGSVTAYSSHDEFVAGMRSMLEGVGSVAMEYSPFNEIPVIAKVDAGTVELVRSFGVDVVSSGDLISSLEARLSPERVASALRAGKEVREVMMEAFAFVKRSIEAGRRITEYEVRQHILAEFERRGLVTDHPPIVGVGPNSANPHYEPTEERSAEIREGDFLLVDLWAREAFPGSVFGDITWVGYVGEDVPERFARVFDIVRRARDGAFDAVREAFRTGSRITGGEPDDVARRIISEEGYGANFIHRTGHSITADLHGAGANIDNFETRDTRTILSATSFSIEPGIYLHGDFGVRSELDVVITEEGDVLAPSGPLQTEVIPILR